MSEPRRPPPPKSYIPLDLSTGPPKLPPRPPPAGKPLPSRINSFYYTTTVVNSTYYEVHDSKSTHDVVSL